LLGREKWLGLGRNARKMSEQVNAVNGRVDASPIVDASGVTQLSFDGAGSEGGGQGGANCWLAGTEEVGAKLEHGFARRVGSAWSAWRWG